MISQGGQVVIAAFAPHGPEKCSGLEVCRHDAASVSAELGTEDVVRASTYMEDALRTVVHVVMSTPEYQLV